MAQKYIIGDLVKVILDDEEQVVKVIGYDPTYERYLLTNEYIDETRGCISVAEDKIKPIRLTRKIIKKNGWKRFARKYNDSRFWFNDNIGDSAEFEEFNGHFSPKIFKLPIIHYVHQLQHYFFGLGIKIEIKV